MSMPTAVHPYHETSGSRLAPFDQSYPLPQDTTGNMTEDESLNRSRQLYGFLACRASTNTAS
jgi:hypothetical protein